jgi:hypothetical protein
VERGKDLVKTISKEKINLQNMLKSIQTIEKLVQSEPLNNLHKIKQESIKVENTLKQTKFDEFVKEDIEQYITSIRSKIPEWEEQVKKSFGNKLEDTLKQIGFELEGHYPLLKVSFYTLDVDLYNNNVVIWYGPQQERVDICKLIPEQVAKKLTDIHNKITQRQVDGKTFLSNLYEAYRIATYRHNKKNHGDQIAITDILFEYVLLAQNKKFKTNPIKNNYKEYGRVFFSYDLYKLKERKISNYEISLITATRAYTRQKYDFLWIPSNEKGDGNYISHIKFREV